MAHRRTQRVHFSPDEDTGHGEGKEILSADIHNDVLNVHLGFLKVNHHYRVTVLITNRQLEECVQQGRATRGSSNIQLFPNVRCKIVQLCPTQDGLQLAAEIYAEQEKVFKEQLYFHVPERDEPLRLQLEASVFGRFDGCPRLNPGVRCIGYEKEYESDTSMEKE